MNDQAQKLRELAAASKPEARIITVTSGKGGVGKSNVVINLAVIFSRMGKRTLIIDADLGLANIDILLGLQNRHSINDVMDGRMSLRDIVVEDPLGIKVVPGSSGIPQIANLSARRRREFIDSFKDLQDQADIILIDTSAGLSKNVIKFALIADEVVLVTTPEPSAITDAYAMIKVLSAEKPEADIGLIVNQAKSQAQAVEVANKIAEVSKQFLNFPVSVLGTLPFDPHVQRAVMRRRPWAELYPKSAATGAIKKVAAKLLNGAGATNGSTDGLIHRISNYFRAGAEAREVV
jgi:flagellar biosynthesis protein FlhG